MSQLTVMDESNNNSDKNNTSKPDKRKERSINEEKLKIKKQIEELKKLILDIQLELDITTYEEYEFIGEFSSLHSNSQSLTSTHRNIDNILQYELFKMSGFYCSKVTENEFVFNFTPSSNFKSPCAVQIFADDESVRLGAWVMPWGITIDTILSEIPLHNPKNIAAFLKSCKHKVDCHADRKEQFEKLKELASPIKNVEIDATLGYITILCHFLDVYDNSKKRKFKLTVNLHYDIGRVRPSSINIEWNLKQKLSKDSIIEMKTFAKYFKMQNLTDAFISIMEQLHPIYVWKAEKYSDSILDVTKTYSLSEDDISTTLSEDEHEKNFRNQKKSRHLTKRRAESSPARVVDEKSNQTSVDTSKTDKELTQNISNSKIQTKKRDEKIPAVSKQKNSNLKSKQTTLSFRGVPMGSKSIDTNKNMKRMVSNITNKKTMHSTPMTLRSITHKYQTQINLSEISPIAGPSTAKINLDTSQQKNTTKNKKKKTK